MNISSIICHRNLLKSIFPSKILVDSDLVRGGVISPTRKWPEQDWTRRGRLGSSDYLSQDSVHQLTLTSISNKISVKTRTNQSQSERSL